MWLNSEKVAHYKEMACQLICKYGDKLTWEQAQLAVLPDTLELAKWQGLKNSGKSPVECIRALKGFGHI